MTLRRRGYLVEESNDVLVNIEGFVSGQEPDESSDEWAGDIEANVVLRGEKVAQLLGKQRRVLGRALEKLTKDKALHLVSSGRGNKVSAEVLRVAKAKIRRFVSAYAREEFGRAAKVDDVDFTESPEYWSARIDPGREEIKFVIEFGATGEWK